MTPSAERWLYLINPNSGTLPASERVRRITSCDSNCDFRQTAYPGEATALSQSRHSEYEAVVAVGGDGTVRETAEGLIGRDCRLVILPVGSGNGLARHLRIPMRMDRAIAALRRGKPARMDAYRANGIWGFNVCGLGFDGAVAKGMRDKQSRGLRAYIKLIFSLFNTSTSFHVEVSGSNHEAFLVAIANGSQYGNHAVIAPSADVQDGQLDCIILEKPSWWEIPWVAWCLRSNAVHLSSRIRTRKGSVFIVKADRPLPFHIDGDYIGETTELRVTVEPGVINVQIP